MKNDRKRTKFEFSMDSMESIHEEMIQSCRHKRVQQRSNNFLCMPLCVPSAVSSVHMNVQGYIGFNGREAMVDVAGMRCELLTGITPRIIE